MGISRNMIKTIMFQRIPDACNHPSTILIAHVGAHTHVRSSSPLGRSATTPFLAYLGSPRSWVAVPTARMANAWVAMDRRRAATVAARVACCGMWCPIAGPTGIARTISAIAWPTSAITGPTAVAGPTAMDGPSPIPGSTPMTRMAWPAAIPTMCSIL